MVERCVRWKGGYLCSPLPVSRVPSIFHHPLPSEEIAFAHSIVRNIPTTASRFQCSMICILVVVPPGCHSLALQPAHTRARWMMRSNRVHFLLPHDISIDSGMVCTARVVRSALLLVQFHQPFCATAHCGRNVSRAQPSPGPALKRGKGHCHNRLETTARCVPSSIAP